MGLTFDEDEICGVDTYDAATAQWGAPWRMPTKDEAQELLDKCRWKKHATLRGMDGYKATGPSGKSIFLPAAGARDSFSLEYTHLGCYWLATPADEEDDKDGDYAAYHIELACENEVKDFMRETGMPVRPVSD